MRRAQTATIDRPPTFDKAAYLARRRGSRRRAWALGVASVLLMIAAPRAGGPLAVAAGLALALTAIHLWGSARRPPLHEALQVARDQGGEATRTDLLLALEVRPEDLDLLIAELVAGGFLERVEAGLPVEGETRYRLVDQAPPSGPASSLN